MNRISCGPLGALLFALACLPAAPALAQLKAPAAAASEPANGGEQWRLLASPYTHHWRYSAEHKHVWALGFERQAVDESVLGASYFTNSFGQPSAYVYYGQRYKGFFGQPDLFAQWSVGMLYGYKGKFEDKVPLNYKGFSPGALLTGGWQFTREQALALHLLGDAGVMFEWSYRLR